MPTNFPGSLDTTTQLPTSRADGTSMATNHAADHDNVNAATVAVETKIGTGSSTPTSGTVLTGTGTGTSAWQAPSSGGQADMGWVVYGGTAGSTAAASANVTAWNTAVSALPTDGGTIFVKAGVYYINGNLSIDRSDVYVLGAAGAAFSMVGGSNFCAFTLGNLSASPIRTDITIDNIELDGGVRLQNIANSPAANSDSSVSMTNYSGAVSSATNTTNATITVTGALWGTTQFVNQFVNIPGNDSLLITSHTNSTLTLSGVFATAPSAGDGFFIAPGAFNRKPTAVSNTTNATMTVSGASWGTTRFVGMYVNILTGTGASQSKLITSHTATVLTLSGVWGTAPTTSSTFQISTQPFYISANWEGTFGADAIAVRGVYRCRIVRCNIHDWYNTGIELNMSGAAIISENYIDNCGMQFQAGPGNHIATNAGGVQFTDYPAHNIVVSGNNLRRITDVGIDIHGNGAFGVTCVGNTVYQQSVASGGSQAGWGISVEIEAADQIDNVGASISGNHIDKVVCGISVTNTGNTTRNFAAMAVTGNIVVNSQAAVFAEGHHLNISGNTFWNMGSGIGTNNATAVGLSLERDWNIVGNTIHIDPTQNTFGNWGIGLRWQAAATGATIATVTSSPTTNGQTPIVLNMSGGWTGGTPIVGAVIVVTGAVGDTAANGAWEIQAVTSTQVTLKGSTSNGTWSSGGTISYPARSLDSVTIEGNTLQGAGTGNTQDTHSGIYVEAMINGTQNASIAHVNIGANAIHGFNHGVALRSGGVQSLVLDCDVRGVRAWNNAGYGMSIGTGAIRGTTVEVCDFGSNVTGAITGNTAGVGGNVDTIRNCAGFNPVGLVTLPRGSIPSAPTTTTVYTNNTNYDGTMLIAGGTVTVITLAGTTSGFTSGQFRLPRGQTIAVTFSVAPTTWKFVAD